MVHGKLHGIVCMCQLDVDHSTESEYKLALSVHICWLVLQDDMTQQMTDIMLQTPPGFVQCKMPLDIYLIPIL